VKLWRIAAETRKHAATDLSGMGAAANPGRWNDDKEPVVYCASTIAMPDSSEAANGVGPLSCARRASLGSFSGDPEVFATLLEAARTLRRRRRERLQRVVRGKTGPAATTPA
jgi:hypothetical protein